MNLNNFNQSELTTILRFTKAIANKNNADFFELDAEPLEEVERTAKAIATRRNSGYGGRVLIDVTDEDKEIRAEVRKYLRSRNIIPKSVKD